MTRSELKELVSVWLDDLNFGYFTEAQINRWLNQGQREVQKLLILAGEHWYTKCAETTLAIGQEDYLLPDDFLKVERLEIITNAATNETRPLQRVTLNQQDLFPNGNSQSDAYYIRRNRIILVPPPETADPLRLTYTLRIADMTLDTDLPDVPEEYHEMVALFAARDGFLKDDRAPTTILDKLEEYKDRMKRDSDERSIDRSRQVVITNDDGFGGLF